MSTFSAKISQKSHEYHISEEQIGQRVDNFLFTYLKGVPKSRVYRILRKGEVRINKGRVKPSYRLQAGDCIRIPPIRTAEKNSRIKPSDRVLNLIDSHIIYEDKRVLILNKPSGIAVHGGSGLSFGIIEILRNLRPDAPYLELVHRLDRDTSGCLVIAKKRSALRQLHEFFRTDAIEKQYLALVSGRWQKGARRVSASLQKNVLKSGERIVTVNPQGKSALSIFEPIEIYEQASLMRVRLKTGRTHQIRVHASHIGHAIAGDEKYGDQQFNKRMSEYGLKRLFLHAEYLAFKFSDENSEIAVHAPLDDGLQAMLTKLTKLR